MQPAVVPAQRPKALHQCHIAVVFELGGPLAGVHMLGVAPLVGADVVGRHSRQGVDPVQRVVASRFPRVQQGHQTCALRVAAAVEPLVPAIGRLHQQMAAVAGVGGLWAALPQLLQHQAQHRRLGDARGWHRPSGAPDLGARKVAVVGFVEHDVRHHAVGPLVHHQRFHLAPSAVVAELLLAQGGQARIPVPLKRVEPVGGHGVVPFVVELQDAVRLLHHGGGVHLGSPQAWAIMWPALSYQRTRVVSGRSRRRWPAW